MSWKRDGTWDHAKFQRKSREITGHTHFYRAYVNRTINEIISYFDFGMFSQYFARYLCQFRWWKSSYRLIVKAFRSNRINDEDWGITSSPMKCERRTKCSARVISYLVLCWAPLSLTTIVMIASLLTFRRSLWTRTTSSILILLTRSPITRTKSLDTSPLV